MTMTAGIILAGGQSRRMGRDKALLPLPTPAQGTFLQGLLSTLTAACDEVVLVARDTEQAELYTPYLSPSVCILTDNEPGVGPLMGLYTGLSAIQSTHAFVTAVDTPLLQPALVTFLLAQPLDEVLLVPVVGEIPQVLLAVYPKTILPLIEERLHAGRRDPRSLLQAASVRYLEEELLCEVDPDLRSFLNVNTPEELERLSELKKWQR